jgi:2-polyprenyl-6-methoxyphenol hydroxylase-like FAD-dependent oxidoreductase
MMAAKVIIVGAGPVGLMLAGELRLGGVDVVVYDRLPAPSGESRGLGFTSRTAEVLDQRGLLPRLGEIRWGRHGHYGGVRIDFTLLEENHFGVMGLAQSRTEDALGAWLADLGVPVRRGAEVTDVRQTGDAVHIRYDGAAGPGADTAAYLVGCDGGRSTVRALTGIEFPGWAATRGIYMADVVGADVRPRPIGERLPGGGMVLSVGIGEGVTRIVIHEPGVRPCHGETPPTFAEIADAWERMTGESIGHGTAPWMTALTNAAGLAAEFRRGRVFLAGDAAHDHAPLGAQGVSVGLQDAVNLGWKLAAAVNGWAPDGLLDTYHTERHPVGQQLLRDVAAQSLLYLTGEDMEPLRTVVRELVTYPDPARHLAGLVSGLHLRYDMGAPDHPVVGMRLAPGRELTRADGTRVRVAELLHTARGVLVSTDGSSGLARVAAGWADRVDHVTGTWADEADGPDAVLLRPDGHIAWAAPGGEDLGDALGRWFGSAHAARSAA